MDYEGLLEFLSELQAGHALAAWQLEQVSQIGPDDTGDMRFAVIISLGALQYRLSSYIPPASVVRDIQRILTLHGQEGGGDGA